MLRKDRGFTLIELLIVVAIIGIIAAIAIPNLLNAIDRGRQKRTMADMRTIGTAMESYAVDNNFYPKNQNGAVSSTVETYLEPTYVRNVPSTDGWRNDFQAETDANGGEYTLQSYGKNGSDDGCTSGTTITTFDEDICFSNGSFTQWPEGRQE